MAETNEHVGNTLEFSNYVDKMKTGSKHEWSKHGDLLTRVLDQLYSSPVCRTYFDDSFAFLSPDIIHDVVDIVLYRCYLTALIKVQSPWGAWAIKRSAYLDGFDPKFGDTTLWSSDNNEMYETRWKKFLEKAPRLYGKLYLHGLCDFVGSGEALYSALKPQFHDLTLKYHIKEERSKHEHLSAFMAKQLLYPSLQKVTLCVNADLELDDQLLKFCLSDNFQFLDWNCPISTTFFVRVYNAFKDHGSVPADKTRKVTGFFDRSALKEIVQALPLRRTIESYSTYRITYYSRKDRCAEFNDCLVSILLLCDTAAVNVTIEVKRIDLTKVETEDADGEYEEEEIDDCEDIDVNDYWINYPICKQKCDLESKINKYDWTEEDCADCTGCVLCEPTDERCCYVCGEYHYCNPHEY